MAKVMEGVFAVNKPTGITSAQALRDLQHHFNPSELFSSWISSERDLRTRESHNQQRRRKEKKIQVKIGHGGTLDPLATGVLIAGVGKGTKSLQDFLLCTKTYDAVVLFGTSTDTYDRVGKVLRRAPYEHITRELVEEHLEQFRGKFQQLPPLYSALKMNGKPLYEYAREGKEIPREIERRPVEVTQLEILEWMEGGTHTHEAPTDEAGHAEVNVANKFWKSEDILPAAKKNDTPIKEETQVKAEPVDASSTIVAENFEQSKRKMSEDQDDLVSERPASKREKASEAAEDATMSGGLAPEASTKQEPAVKGPPAAKIRMTVTSGFYVRSLCHDLGASLGSAALMAELQRTRQGEFTLGENVLEWEDLSKGEKVWGPKVSGWLDDWNEKRPGMKSNHSHAAEVSKGAAPAEVNSEVAAEVAEPSTAVPAEAKAEVAELTEPEKEVISEKAAVSEKPADDAVPKGDAVPDVEVKDENKEILVV